MERLAGEVLNINNEYGSYKEYKAAVDSELQRSAESFVRIGYLLKLARDTDILMESGYGSVNEFAQAEYNLDKSQVSRFIGINDEYSENGYSDRLKEKYRAFGYAKLALMLTLPAAVNEELSPAYSKTEIQEIKKEVDAEKEISDIEVMLEGQDSRQETMESVFDKVLYQMGHDYPEIYKKLHEYLKMKCGADISDMINGIKEIIAPAGESMYFVRIQGTGKMMIFFRDSGEEISIVNVRSGEKEIHTWQQVYEALYDIMDPDMLLNESWMKAYGEDIPEEKPKVAPVQPQEKAEKRKISKVNKPEPKSMEKEPSTEMKEESSPAKDETEAEQIPGQTNITDFPECIPDDYQKPEVAPVQPEISEDLVKETFETYMEELKKELDNIHIYSDARMFKNAHKCMDKAAEILNKLEALPETGMEADNGEA